MREKSEKDEKYRLGRHWQTIQRSLSPEWEREADGKIVEEGRVSEPFGHRPDARRVVRRIGQVVEIVERCTAGDSRMAAISVVVYG